MVADGKQDYVFEEEIESAKEPLANHAHPQNILKQYIKPKVTLSPRE